MNISSKTCRKNKILLSENQLIFSFLWSLLNKKIKKLSRNFLLSNNLKSNEDNKSFYICERFSYITMNSFARLETTINTLNENKQTKLEATC